MLGKSRLEQLRQPHTSHTNEPLRPPKPGSHPSRSQQHHPPHPPGHRSHRPIQKPKEGGGRWWNHSLTLAKEATKGADRRARLTPTNTNRQDSQYKRRKWTTMVHNAKMTYHVHRLQNATTRTIWKTIQCHSTHNKPIPPLEGQSDFRDKCKALRNALFPPVNTAPRTPLPPDFLTHTRDIRPHTRPVTIHETRLAIAHLKYGTSVGPDNISYTTLRHFNEAAPLLLPNLFTACLTWSVHPPEWMTANCVVVPKPGKKSYSQPKSYWPISLLSYFGKLLETIIAKRLAHAAQICGATHPSQMGAQAENSAVDALLRTIDPIAKAISQKKALNKFPLRPTVLTHDIEGAFNQVHPATLREVMIQRRMPLYFTNWVTAFNTDRKLAVGFNQQTEQPQPYECGLPQGSPISPILFLIYSNAMLEEQHHPCDATDTSHIDDVCMVQMSPTMSRANTLLKERTDQHLQRGDPVWDSPLPPQKRNSCTASPHQ